MKPLPGAAPSTTEFDSCPGNEKVDFSACIDATNAATCVDLPNTVLGCHVQQG
jgi:hypothetical protein